MWKRLIKLLELDYDPLAFAFRLETLLPVIAKATNSKADMVADWNSRSG